MGTNQSLYRVDAPPDTEDLQQVIAWAHQQFQMIDTMLQTRELVPNYGGAQLRAQDGPAADQPLNLVPQILTPYDQLDPPLDRSSGPEGVIVDIGAGTLTFDSGGDGIYLLAWWFSAQIAAGTDYRVEAFLNGVATGLITLVDSSNQTDEGTLETVSLVAIIDGDVIDVRGTALGPGPGPEPFIVNACQFYAAKIGGRLGGALLPTP